MHEPTDNVLSGLSRPALTGLTPAQLAALMPIAGRPSLTRGKAVWRALRSGPFDRWPALGGAALAQLQAHTTLPDLRIDAHVTSADGTQKWRLAVAGRAIETVMIPLPTRSTVCVSSQSGCTRWCDFCATARMSYAGNLDAGALVAQVLLARMHAPSPVTNVVFMGMGEPLDNLDAVLQAVTVLDQGLGIAPRHTTVSTSGVLPKMERLWRESRAAFALSLHATTQELRDRLMPRVKKWPIADLIAFMRQASAEDRSRHFFIEYALLDGVNDHLDDADRLVALLDGVNARVNLIPFNATPGIGFQRPSVERIRAFQARVAAHVLCITRETRGDDSAAACGQLASQ